MPTPYSLRRTLRAGALLMLALTAACGNDVTDPRPAPDGPPAVASVEITPGTLELPVSGSRALSATPRARNGSALSGRQVEWKSSDDTVVRVDGSGNVTALREGTATVTATSGGKQGQAQIQVVPPPPPAAVASVQVIGGDVEMEPGERLSLGVVLRAADGTALAGREVAWTSSDTSIVRVYPNGSVLGRRAGTATITATSEGKTGRTTLRIPEWINLHLHSLGEEALPAVIAASSDTTENTAQRIVTRERRVRLARGYIRLSTLNWLYQQSFELQTWERTVTVTWGGVTYGEEELTGSRWIVDQGEATEFTWAGEPIYRSAVFADHTFGVDRPVEGGRRIRQPIPGEGTEAFDLRYAKPPGG